MTTARRIPSGEAGSCKPRRAGRVFGMWRGDPVACGAFQGIASAWERGNAPSLFLEGGLEQ